MLIRPALQTGLLISVIAIPAFSKDWLFVTTNWGEDGKEQILRIDSDDGQLRTLWNGGSELDAVVSPDATRLYVTFIEDKRFQLAIVDTANGAVLQKVETPELIRWIFPSTPGMAISADGRWLYLLKTNYSAGSYDFFLLPFDTQEGRFVSGDRAISNCPEVRLLPVPASGKLRVLCGRGEAGPQSEVDFVERLEHVQNFALSPVGDGHTIYATGRYGPIQAVDIAAHQILRASGDPPLHSKRIMPSSNTISPDGRLWYLPVATAGEGQQIEQILVFDIRSMSRTSIITPVGPFWGLALSSDGRRLYASQHDQRNILAIDTTTWQTINVFPVGAKPSILLAVRAP